MFQLVRMTDIVTSELDVAKNKNSSDMTSPSVDYGCASRKRHVWSVWTHIHTKLFSEYKNFLKVNSHLQKAIF